jgi:hypothetical protein
MAEARGRQQWEQTALIVAMLHNSWRGQGQPARAPNDFNPYAEIVEEPREEFGPKEGMKLLKSIFGGTARG